MARRSAFARSQDLKKRARRVFKPNGYKTHLWRAAPQRYDLRGVDVAARREKKRFFGSTRRGRKLAARTRLTGIELLNLKNDFTRQTGAANDALDFRALIDPSLNYAENKANLRRKYGVRSTESLADEFAGFDFRAFERWGNKRR